jgi:DNA-binding response OmpR family regulator
MKRRILLVDDEVAVLLTLKAVLEISGFDVDTAASGREGVSRLHTHQYNMLITDMRMENDAAGIEVIHTARTAAYHPAIALLTAFPVADEDWQEMGADKLLVKPMHTKILLQQIEDLIDSHEKKLASLSNGAGTKTASVRTEVKKTAAKKVVSVAVVTKKSSDKPPAAVKKTAKKSVKTAVAKKSTKKHAKAKV